MITEDFVSFEIAKLLKEKGFDGDTASCYILEDSTHHIMSDKIVQSEYYESQDSNEHGHLIQAPTLQMAMKWLREVHNIHIDINTNWAFKDDGFIVVGYMFNTHSTINSWYQDLVNYPTYEKACEVAVLYCLEKLI